TKENSPRYQRNPYTSNPIKPREDNLQQRNEVNVDNSQRLVVRRNTHEEHTARYEHLMDRRKVTLRRHPIRLTPSAASSNAEEPHPNVCKLSRVLYFFVYNGSITRILFFIF